MGVKKIISYLFIALLTISSCTSDETRKTNHFQNGMVFFEKGEFKNADLEFRNALQIDPSFADGYFMLGKVKLTQKKYKDAYLSFKKAEKIDPDHLKVQLELAKIYHAAGKFDVALEKLKKFLGQNPENHDAQLLQGYLMIAKRQFADAVLFFEKLMGKGHLQSEIFLSLATAYKGIGDYKRCEEILMAGLKEHPKSPTFYAGLSRLYVNTRQIDKAVTILEQGIQTSIGSIQLSVLLAKLNIRTNKIDQARIILERAIQNDSSASVHEENSPQTLLAEIYMDVGKFDEAENLLTRVLENDPENSEAQFVNGRLNLFRDNIAGAVKAFEKVVKVNPHFMKGHGQLAVALVRDGNLTRAEAVLWKALYINPHWSEIARFHARILFMQKEYQKAELQLTKYIGENPDDIAVIAALGDLFYRLENSDQAENQYRTIIQKAPQNPAGYLKLSKLLDRSDRKKEASAILEKGYQNNPDSKIIWAALTHHYISQKQQCKADEFARTLMNKHSEDPFVFNLKGKLYTSKKEFSNAEKAFQKAISLAPAWKEPRSNLTRLYLAQGKEKEITDKIRQELENDPENPIYYSSLAHLYLQTGHFEDAMQVYANALNNGIEHWEINNDYAFLLTDHSEIKLDRAVQLARKALKQNPGHPAILDTLGWISYKKGDMNQAQLCFARALSINPKAPSINYHMGMVAYQKGRTGKSFRYLERAMAAEKIFPERKKAEKIMEKLQTLMVKQKKESKEPVETMGDAIEMESIFNSDLTKTLSESVDNLDPSLFLDNDFTNDFLNQDQESF